VVGIADDDVVEDFELERLAGSNEIAGNSDVRFGRSRFPDCSAQRGARHSPHGDHPELGGANVAELRAKLATERRTRKQEDLS